MKITAELLFIASVFGPIAWGVYAAQKPDESKVRRLGNAAGMAMLAVLGLYLSSYLAGLS